MPYAPSARRIAAHRLSAKPAGKVVPLVAVAIVLLTGAVLVYGTLDMPRYGAPQAPANLHVVPRYIEKAVEETGAINMVTAVLIVYRGYDTLGETVVIFTAGVSVVFLLRRRR